MADVGLSDLGSDENRPDPDALLKRLAADEIRTKQAKLKIFFGFAPGVGKTYAMLESAHRLKRAGVDVVVGCVETHGRNETAELVRGLEVLPRRVVTHRGARLEELDLEQALRRRPKVLLLDELAHTNAPGSLHKKRHQDVLDLLAHGIDVHTTLNVQHVESLNDVVAQVTTVRVRETVPDAILDRADEIELVDIPPDELLRRLQAGKVYLSDQAARAVEHFFKRGNLLALRELALRRTADRVDKEMLAYREENAIESTWAAGERILVCVSPSPGSASLIRGARRMAAGLRAQWVAAYVEPSLREPFSQHDRERLDANLRLAESLGGEVVRLTGASVSGSLLDYARKRNVTRILIGKPTHPRIRDRLRGSLLDEVVRASGDIDVHVISGDAGTPAASPPKPSARPTDWQAHALAAMGVATVTGLAWLGREILSSPDIIAMYLLAIMVVATRAGRGPSLFASFLSVLAYDFFFVAPFYTFAVSDHSHVLTFVMMFGVGAVMSGLTGRIRQQEQNARSREARTASLYALSRELGSAVDEVSAAWVLARHTAELFSCGALVVLDRDRSAAAPTVAVGQVPYSATEQAVVRWVFDHGRPAGLGTDTLEGARLKCVAIRAGGEVLGVLALAPNDAASIGLEARDFLEAVARQGALALERSRSADEAKAAALRARAEEMRSSLLSAVSHDLRTPLAAITGAATTLRDDSASLPPLERSGLLESICEEAERLERLVGNLLDMTSLESGGVSMKREWIPLEEIVGSALTRLEKKLGSRRVDTTIAADVPLLHVEPVLFEQVFINLLENVCKYTPSDSPVTIEARCDQTNVVIEVGDRGPGLPAGREGQLFEKFVRGSHVGIRGVGLGLAICKGIVDAHGGRIDAENRAGGGALFRVTIPVAQGAPATLEPIEEEA